MHTCPNCKTEFRQRKGGACPHCDTPLQIWNGRVFRATGSSPNVALLERFERLVSDKTSAIQRQPVVWRIPRKGQRYMRELVSAEKLLEACEYDLDLALDTMDVLFQNPQFARGNYTSLMGFFQSKFELALAVARVQREKLAKKDAVQEAYFDSVMQQTNLFAD